MIASFVFLVSMPTPHCEEGCFDMAGFDFDAEGFLIPWRRTGAKGLGLSEFARRLAFFGIVEMMFFFEVVHGLCVFVRERLRALFRRLDVCLTVVGFDTSLFGFSFVGSSSFSKGEERQISFDVWGWLLLD
jgi:hypothetical protein